MDPLALFTSTDGRLGRRTFWLCVPVIYATGFASQVLLAPEMTARGGVWAFALVQALLIWAWAAVHIKRARDAGQAPATAIAVALIYALAVVLLLVLIAFLTNPNVTGAPPAGAPAGGDAGNPWFGLMLGFVILALLFSPDFGAFMIILKLIIFIACLPAIISLVFSLITGLRRSAPP